MAVVEEISKDDDVQVVDGSDDEDTAKTTSDSVAAKAPEAPAAPAAPAAPEFKMSQLIPMVAMFGLQKYNLEEMGLVHHVEALYVIVQLACFTVLYLTYDKINKMADGGEKIKIPETKQMGQVVAPAKVQTVKEYDMEKIKESIKQPLIGFLILGGIYYKWGSLMPLVMQVLMTPMQLYEAPLTQIHFFGKTIKRPFVVPSMFGLPAAPEPETEAVADATVEKKKKDK
jgi:hypothetical protein